MNLFALITLFSFVFCVFIAAFVYFGDTKSLPHKLYMAFTLGLGAFALLQFGYRSSRSYEEACFWWQIDFFWPLITPILLHFVLAFTEKTRLLRRKWVYAAIYGPAIVIIILDMTLHVFTGPPVQQDWGWTFGAPANLANGLAYVWQEGLVVLSIVISIVYLRAAKDRQKRNQIKWLVVGLSVGVLGTIVELVLIFLSIPAPPLAVAGFIVGNCFLAYSIKKYKMFTLTPSTAADNILATMTDALLLVSPEGKILSSNAAALTLLGIDNKQLKELPLNTVFSKDVDRPSWLAVDKHDHVAEFEPFTDLETSFSNEYDENIPISLAGSALHDDHKRLLGYVLIGRDITDRKKTEKELDDYRNHLEDRVKKRTIDLEEANEKLRLETIERLKVENERASLEKQLQHAQKMEAIGRLAGGVAHDFNNLLFVITGYIETFVNAFAPDDPLKADAEEIQKAAKRATSLTQQLLAFSRRQVIQPKVINLNETLDSAKNLLSRIIEENIEMTFRPTAKSARVTMDPTQVDQIVANLIVNARDAMPNGGKLMISTSNIKVKNTDFFNHPEAPPGDYILLTVTDTGCGMDETTVNKIFEPFFTTKETGKGTGLGLSTVYGIAKQNRGFVEVKSKLGEGTSFNIYLPQVESDIHEEDEQFNDIVPRGKETILLVEDEAMVRRLASQFLKRQGYNVLEAGDAKEALKLTQQFKGDIDLLFTDVVMPGMDGKQLSEHLVTNKPDLRVLFMSGHNDEIMNQYGCLEEGIPLIQKPFSSSDLYWKIREVLDA